MKNFHRILIIGCSTLALSACGPQDLGSPGVNGDINIGDIINNSNNTTTTTTGTTGGTGGGGIATPANSCPTITNPDPLVDKGTMTGPSGTWRVCQLPSLIAANTTLPFQAGTLYQLNGRVDVGTDDGPTTDAGDGYTGTLATLTIQPGVIITSVEGVPGGSYLVVERGSKLISNGTSTRPIIWTGDSDVLGATQDDTSALWGGIILLGRAPIADCETVDINPPNQADCQATIEGIENNIPYFGGNTPDDSSGSIKFNQIRYSGYVIGAGNELQSLSMGGVGSGTVLDYLQSYNSSDDGMEMWGGHVNFKHYIAVGAEDDSIDTDGGVQLNLQYAVAVQRDNVGDKLIENDSPEGDHGPGTTLPDAGPRTLSQIVNFSLWGKGNGEAIQARGAGDITLANGVIYKPAASGKECINEHGAPDNPDHGTAGTATDRRAIAKFYSLELDCTDGDFTDQAIAAGNGAENKFLTNSLTSKHLDGSNEMNDFNPFAASGLDRNGFSFDDTSYIGAVPTPVGSDTPWTSGWTCDSTTVSFGSGASCKGLPVFN